MLVAFAGVEGILSGASSGTGDALDFGLLTASATGVSDLARGSLVAVVSLALLLAGRPRPALRDRIYLGGGAAVLLTYALSGHALAFPTFWALLDQGVHVLAAGLWLGGVLALALVTLRGGVRLLDGARAFAPVAGAALGIAIVTGVLAAVREVDQWYFLRWSDYGRLVIVKAVARRARRAGRGRRLVALARRRRRRPAAAAAARRDGRRARRARARDGAVGPCAGPRPAAARPARDAVRGARVRDRAAAGGQRAGRARAGAHAA